MKKLFIVLMIVWFAFPVSVMAGGDQEKTEDATAIKWKPILSRIAADKYVLPDGWQEAVKGVDEITVFNSGTLLPPDPATAENAKIFEELTGVKVRFIESPADQLVPKQIAMAISKSSAADVLSIFEFEFEAFMKAGWIEPLDEIWDDESLAKMPKAFVNAATYNGISNSKCIFQSTNSHLATAGFF